MSDIDFNNINFSDFDINKITEEFKKISETKYDLNNLTPIGIEKKEIIKNICISCETDKYLVEDFKQGIIVCNNCGIVLKELFDESAEWKSYSGETTENARTSGVLNPYLPNISMKISIGGKTKSFLKTANTWSTNKYDEDKIIKIMCYIQKICSKYKIPKNIEQDTNILYCKLSQARHTNGKNKGKYFINRGHRKSGYIAACLFYGCKKNGFNILKKDLAKMFGITQKNVSNGRKKILYYKKLLSLELDTSTSIIDDYINIYSEKLGIKDNNIIKIAEKLAKNIRLLGFISNHKPISIASAIIYLVVQKNNNTPKLTQKLISIKLNISEVTLIKLYKLIESKYDKLLNDNYINEYIKNIEKIKKTLTLPTNIITSINYMKKYNKEIYDSITV